MTALTFTALDAPANLPGVRAVLREHGLHAPRQGPLLTDATGATPLIGGAPLAFEASYLGAGARTFYGTIFGASPAVAELAYDLAVRGNLLVTASPGPPHIVVCGGTHSPADVTDEAVPPWLEIVCLVNSAPELSDVLAGAWRRHRSTFADRYWGGPETWPAEYR